MRLLKTVILCATALSPLPAFAADAAEDAEQRTIIVTGAQEEGSTATKTDTPISETPQPISPRVQSALAIR
jgi:iron complex outermembrane receptor protein